MNSIPTPQGTASPEQLMAARFAGMVMQQANMALLLLGQMPHPETGETTLDLEGARLFIDQLEMLAVKTRGNLGKEEEQLLQQSLMATRMAFVEAVDRPPAAGGAAAAPVVPSPTPPADPAKPTDAPTIVAGPDADDESTKRFTKKY